MQARLLTCRLLQVLGIVAVIVVTYNYGASSCHDMCRSSPLCKMKERMVTKETNTSLLQDDPELVEYIRRHLLVAPTSLPYNLTNANIKDFSQFGQPFYLMKNILHGMKGGFFVEAGAVDGEYLSNTLYLERNFGWTGLLIEPFPDTYRQLLYKQRKAYSVNAALSVTNVSSTVTFKPQGNKGVLSLTGKKGITVKALPLYSLLLALNVTVVDFFSLDIEGIEVKVLKTIPWDKVKFRVLCIESNHIPERKKGLQTFMESKGYKHLANVKIDSWFGWPDLLAETRITN